MFKEKCPRCSKSVDKKFSFCPYCGLNLEEEREMDDFGFLGKEDKKELPGLNFSGIFGNMNSMVRDMVKNLEKGFTNEPGKVFSKVINIDLSPGKNPSIKVSSDGKPVNIQQRARKSRLPRLSKEKLEILGRLPKEEPQTEVRRLGDRIVYELNTPGVKSKEDIMINKLEEGLEILAVAKEKVYLKKLPLKLDVIDYSVSEGNLIIEFKA